MRHQTQRRLDALERTAQPCSTAPVLVWHEVIDAQATEPPTPKPAGWDDTPEHRRVHIVHEVVQP